MNYQNEIKFVEEDNRDLGIYRVTGTLTICKSFAISKRNVVEDFTILHRIREIVKHDILHELNEGGELNMKKDKMDVNNQGSDCGCCDGAAGDVIKSRTFKTDHSESDAKKQTFDSAPKSSASGLAPTNKD